VTTERNDFTTRLDDALDHLPRGIEPERDLWPSIEAALLDSEYFLLLASPDAAASEWVQREVAWWLDRRPTDHLLIALTRGEIRLTDGSSHPFDVAFMALGVQPSLIFRDSGISAGPDGGLLLIRESVKSVKKRKKRAHVLT